jgi:uncharacterized protein with FMN-binding domain
MSSGRGAGDRAGLRRDIRRGWTRFVVAGTTAVILLQASGAATGETKPASAAAPAGKTRSAVETAIEEAGQSAPPWWDSVPLNYPKTLDLTWLPNPGPWNPQKCLGQYIWSVINENPSRWREGVKLLHYVLDVNKDDPDKYKQTCQALARAYQALLEDYARAAYWWRKGGGGHNLDLAQCYWKLGSKEMAAEVLDAYGDDDTGDGTVIKLWSDMGELTLALALAEEKAQWDWPDTAWLAAGDACRLAGNYEKAMGYYQRVEALQKGGRLLKRNKARAAANLAALKVYDLADPRRVPDGAYRSESMGYAGPMKIEVTVKGHRIVSVTVVEHKEKQFYAALTDTPRQIERKQSVKGIDALTGATITSEAIINATAKALAAAAK